MDLGRSWLGVGGFGASLVLLSLALGACAGKSERDGGDGDGNGGTGNRGGSAGSPTDPPGRGGTSTTNAGVHRIVQSGVDKVDLLLMIDNSIGMADKQRLLTESLPVLVQLLVDPRCIDANGNAVGSTAATSCPGGSSPQFKPIQDIHIGVITSSLGSHGGDVCVPDAADTSLRTLNDAAQLVASVRPAVAPPIYSYNNTGFLVWDPRTARPNPDPHPGVSAHETNAVELVRDVTTHVQAAGERGCGYEASLESWYRFLIDPEPVDQVAQGVDGFSLRGPINEIVLQQRRSFLRPDSLLAVVMLTDENDCSILDENDSQGWLVGKRVAMPRGSDACSHPENPNIYKCCIPCVLLDQGYTQDGCNYANDAACGAGHSLMGIEDSTNLRCYAQKQRFGIDLLYPWQRYVDGLLSMRVPLRARGPSGEDEAPNPIYTPGADGTPARDPSLVFLAGIVGVPWQDLADDASLQSQSLRYLSASEMVAASPNRWDVILGDPDTGRLPTDPFMIESVDQRVAGQQNPIPGVQVAITAAGPDGDRNAINGSEASIANRDDLQYACIFDIEPDVECTPANQDGCDCNASEQAYNRPTCQYAGSQDGVQTHAKAYPSIRQLQVLKGFGENAIVASVCPKNTQALVSPTQDPNYGYNPAMVAMVDRFKEALAPRCLPRPISTEDDQIPCRVVEAFSAQECSCNLPGRTAVSSSMRGNVDDGLHAQALCGGNTGVSCSDYCMCEIQQFEAAELVACQFLDTDPGTQSGFCYVEPDRGIGSPSLVASCPDTQRQLLRFMGSNVPRPGSVPFLVCESSAD